MSFNSHIYEIDFALAAKRLLPPKRRMPVMSSFLAALLKPLKVLRDDIFTTYRPDIIERMAYNGQTIVLEGILNKKYSITTAPYIYIVNQLIDVNGTYITLTTPPITYIPVDYVGESFIGISYSLSNVNFVVMVPVALFFIVADLRAAIDKYRLLGTTYIIQTY